MSMSFMNRPAGMLCLLLCLAGSPDAGFAAPAAETHFFEAEAMQTNTNQWWVQDHEERQWYYTGAPSRGKLLNGGWPHHAGVATQAVTLATASTFNVWVRYADCKYYRGVFTVEVRQGGTTKAIMTNDVVSLHADDNPAGQAKWGSDYQSWVWAGLPVSLAAGPVEIVLSNSGSTITWLTPMVDCFVLSADLAYEPVAEDFADPLYVKVRLDTAQPVPCAIHMYGWKPYGPNWYMPDFNFYSNRVAVSNYYTGYVPGGPNTNFLSPGCESPWLRLAPFVTPALPNVLWFQAIQEYQYLGAGLSSSWYTVLLSTNASDTGIIRQFSRAGSGSALLVELDMRHLDQLADDRALSEADLAQASFTPEVPTQFPVTTMFGAGATYQPATVSNVQKVAQALGYNGAMSGRSGFFRDGFKTISAAVFDAWGNWSNGCMSVIQSNNLQSVMNSLVQSYVDAGVTTNVLAWYLTDEPSSTTLDHIVGCASCAAAYRTYLQEQGLQPANFGVATWGEVLPSGSAGGNPTSYYHTVNYRSQVLANYFRAESDILHGLVPGARTTANFAEELTGNGNLIMNGVDWFTILREGAMDFGWTENWLGWCATYQMTGYRVDFLRSASPGAQFGMYNVMTGKGAWDTAAMSASIIGHGAKAIFDYNYGPDWAGGTPDGTSSQYDRYPGLHDMHAAIARVEDSLMGAQVPTSRVAMVYAHATDVWTLNDPDGYCEYGKEQMALYLLLRHLGYAVDVVTEQDIAGGVLSGGSYSLALVTGSHLRRDAAQALVAWTTGGGWLYYNAGSLTYDEFNQPLNLDAALGVTRAAYQFKQTCGRELYEFPVLTNFDGFASGSNQMEGVVGVQKISGGTPTNATVLAAFAADTTPALLTRPCGSGRVIFSGTFPGIAYVKSGMQAKAAVDGAYNANPLRATYGPPSYSAAYRQLFAAALSGVPCTPPVITDHYLVEANLLQRDDVRVISLSNWTGESRTNVVVTLPLAGVAGQPVAALGNITGAQWAGGQLTLTLDRLDAADYIVVHAAAAGNPSFVAYNDLAWASGQASSNISRITFVADAEHTTDGALINYTNGADSGITLTCSTPASIGLWATTNLGAPAAGTPADLLFSGKVDMNRAAYFNGDQAGTMTLSGLATNARYKVVLFGNRASTTYSTRVTRVTIGGVNAFVNESSPGAVRTMTGGMPDDTTSIVNGTNSAGLVTCYSGIDAGADGMLTLTVTGNGNSADLVHLNSFLLEGAPVSADRDADGMPDAWETQYLGGTAQNGEGDFDGDGLSNYGEWRSGTDPADAASRFAIETLSSTGSVGVVLRWASATGRVYRAESASNLVVGWTARQSGIAATPPLNTFTAPVQNVREFWRIKIE